ncbi:hypothetical protein GCM10027277_54790 [Pseudoduganella ginsengisoli]|uniref:Uncharacterized protein n=1 Tax=Pseudoduganella ginsengisoli TaxID=1462440 RepID=A0A6L6Q671_9BURK|nr:hypothetical protein [Pseudoduganella ginsengisoli]MTW04914.1 hypothetical protein [Pseudoduganella ginsengisoli]
MGKVFRKAIIGIMASAGLAFLSLLGTEGGAIVFSIWWIGQIMSIDERKSRVALVLEPMFGNECMTQLERMPVWIIDSPQNRAAVEKIRKAGVLDESGVTTFQPREGESLVMACERIVQSLDDHYNERSQTPGYSELAVIGVSLGEVSLRPFWELNFDEFVRTATGFIARRRGNRGGTSENGGSTIYRPFRISFSDA